jgi:hypothetical protein
MRVNEERNQNPDEVAWELAARAAAEMATWTPPDGDVGLRRVAEAIHELFVSPSPPDTGIE